MQNQRTKVQTPKHTQSQHVPLTEEHFLSLLGPCGCLVTDDDLDAAPISTDVRIPGSRSFDGSLGGLLLASDILSNSELAALKKFFCQAGASGFSSLFTNSWILSTSSVSAVASSCAFFGVVGSGSGSGQGSLLMGGAPDGVRLLPGYGTACRIVWRGGRGGSGASEPPPFIVDRLDVDR